MPRRRTVKQAKRFCMPYRFQLELPLVEAPDKYRNEPVAVTGAISYVCPSCDIGAHEHCTGPCSCCGKDES